MRIVFSFTYYTQPVNSSRPGKDSWHAVRRAYTYGLGLLTSARVLQKHWPKARIVIHVPAEELEKRHTRQQVKIGKYLKVLASMPNVHILAFSNQDIPETPYMTQGQRLRMSRYVPFLYLKPGCACIVRDADSVVSVKDIQIIQSWLKDETREWLIYQEIKMGMTMPMGGGIGLKHTAIDKETWERALLHSEFDEDALRMMLPKDVQTTLQKRDLWPRLASRCLVKLPSLQLLQMRMALNGDYYSWCKAKHELIWEDVDEEERMKTIEWIR
jgi:hypothetical protein